MSLFSSFTAPVAVLAAALAFATPAQAAMPAQPTLHVATLDGKTFDLAAQRGKWVIVNYWATWCVPCIKEMPDISRFVTAHNNVTAIGLAYEDSEPADIKAFLAKHPVAYPIAQVSLDQPPKDFDEPRGLPTTYLIDPDGKVAKHIVGPVTEASLEGLIGGK
ncbi:MULTISPECIES: TlpA family protein disulfide reductase [Rhodanobacter]|uniref:Thiol-disulfide isomerase-like thioredoxin n=1 Tax=Rhodanobacter denitrificans TaxID=666685 RepID=M4NK06_9GAMM|nr:MULTISPECIES: TlpA disulfide reductase family protein [Rhodanobacter]AGG88106.1 thiol-disulfide isomerase-like thioredoxin [Rhodanobacter denitrificans]UJM87261.1 TlpA family protein disulfide reductase [Rhodanobacter denitrificans]UJM94752.1 TlpA family protein disulfide reductase [Rhodanobacter denitrificans]UJM98282.1 TlpA family protein disulfide reductase [Rhodanobacter denitrificans]UJN22305.1 TlpA family protein disulfide reductase [Rhodanobacter denitrificans]